MIRGRIKYATLATALLLLICSFAYRVIPVVTLNGKTKGLISAKAFAKVSEIQLTEVRGSNCEIAVYTLFHIPLKQRIQEYKGASCTLSQPILEAMQRAKRGDKYIFYNIRVKCEGDKTPIQVNHLNFNIK